MGLGETPKSDNPSYGRLILRIAIIAIAVLILHLLLDWATARIEAKGNMPLMIGLMTGLLLAYAIFIAIPYMPGIEIGISLLLLRGSEVAPFVYIATLLGLSVAFFAGRHIPYKWLHGFFLDLRFTSACNFLESLEPLGQKQRLEMLSARLPNWLQPALGRGRYLTLAVLLNMPGNVVLGGGGGLAFVAGFSRLFQPWLVHLTMALAVLPIPLCIWFMGTSPF